MPDRRKGKNHKRAKVKKPPQTKNVPAVTAVASINPDKRKKAALARQNGNIAKKLAANG